MQFIDLKRQYAEIKPNVLKGIENVLEHGQYIMGPEVTQLEKELAEYAGTKYSLSCCSGTDALLIPLMAWGVGPGDAVLTTPFTYIATVEVICLLGATPVFVDIHPDTYNINPYIIEDAILRLKEEGKLNPKVIMPVDLFGLPAKYDVIDEIATKYGLYVLEDAAQGFGGKFNNKVAGSFGHVAGTSFFPAKPLGCYGDGGAIFTNDDELFNVMKSIRIHGGGSDKYDNVRLGINGRLDTIQAVVLLEKLKIFNKELERRNEIADRYNSQLSYKFKTPNVPKEYYSTWAQYCILAENSEHRDRAIAKLKENDIPTAIYYPIPCHLQTGYKYLGYKQGDMPITEGIAARIFALPMHPYLTNEEVDLICKNLLEL